MLFEPFDDNQTQFPVRDTGRFGQAALIERIALREYYNIRDLR